MEHQDKVALVTGCSSGIGEATTVLLANAGYLVYATARNVATLDRLRERANNSSLSIETRQLDVTNHDNIMGIISEIKDKHGGLEVLVNNAGYALLGTIEDIPIEDLRKQMEVNVFGLVSICKAVLPLMRHNECGTIVNISSVAGRISVPLMGAYCASKFCVEALSDALRAEVHQFGIRVVTIEPGPVQTKFTENALRESTHIIYNKNSPYLRAYGKLKSMYEDGWGRGKSANHVAKKILKAIQARRPRARYAIRLRDKFYIWAGALTTTKIGQRAMRGYLRLNPRKT